MILDPAARLEKYFDESSWYKDAVIYQTHVKAFNDSDGDGIGDFRGLTEKLDYLENLGITAIWLLPFYPSPLKDDGYDIADYGAIHPSYGVMADFKRFLRKAHKKGIRVITELVINHTSDQHPWFQRARRAPKGSREREFYVWSESMDKYPGVRIIFKDFEFSNWSPDPLTGEYYWHRFYSHQPDLNYDSPDVRQAVFRMMDFWLKQGVDGLRLDAVPYLYQRDGTSCENLPETHAFLKTLRTHIDRNYKNRMLLAEANQWPEDAVAYFGKGDECHMAFHFPIMPRMFMAIKMENRFPIIDILNETPVIPENAQWAMFLRNHDELTLEMVTDRERDFMYHVYARDLEQRINLGIRRRLAPLLGNERRAIELMNSLLFSLPGTPVIYYGDEIGMGDNVFLGDRNGVRTPMQWSADRNAGFSRANPQRLYLPVIIDPEYHYEAVNVETQQNNPRSLLWWMKHAIRLRKQYKAFGRGSLTFLKPKNPKVLAFLREYEKERLLVVVNLSRFAQSVTLDLSAYAGATPVECFGQSRFPKIDGSPYRMTLGSYAFYWFSLEIPNHEAIAEGIEAIKNMAVLNTRRSWENILRSGMKQMEALLPEYLRKRRWFRGKGRRFNSVGIIEDIRMACNGQYAHFLLIQVEYEDETRETYGLPIGFAPAEKGDELLKRHPAAVFSELRVGDDKGVLYDALWDDRFREELLRCLLQTKHFSGVYGSFSAIRFSESDEPETGFPKSRVIQSEQSSTAVIFDGRFFLKFFRKIEPGVNPDLEIGRFLTQKTGFRNFPPVVGAFEYGLPNREPATVAVLTEYVENQGDAWQYTMDYLDRYFERAVAKTAEVRNIPRLTGNLLDCLTEEPPDSAKELFGLYMQQAKQMGIRIGELHLALGGDSSDSAFAPEPFTGFHQKSQYQSMRSLLTQVFRTVTSRLEDFPEKVQAGLRRLLELESRILSRFRPIRDSRLASLRIRTHGNLHLGQLLYTGKDFVIIDFDGEPARSLSERKGKYSMLRDIAGMIRSFHYVSYASMLEQEKGADPLDQKDMEGWRAAWYEWVTGSFLCGYLETCGDSPAAPKNREEIKLLLNAYLLEKALYELGYELNNRPDWVGIPVEGLWEIMQNE